jgi:hypothetical protein
MRDERRSGNGAVQAMTSEAIIGLAGVSRIQAQEAKVARKLSQMAIRDEAIEVRCLQTGGGGQNVGRSGEAVGINSTGPHRLPLKID